MSEIQDMERRQRKLLLEMDAKYEVVREAVIEKNMQELKRLERHA